MEYLYVQNNFWKLANIKLQHKCALQWCTQGGAWVAEAPWPKKVTICKYYEHKLEGYYINLRTYCIFLFYFFQYDQIFFDYSSISKNDKSFWRKSQETQINRKNWEIFFGNYTALWVLKMTRMSFQTWGCH